mmetsp:Transcript_27865/g.52258  ORF Transcript_27865/g.52258 Transcript_27865/m.52258 type:complete len:104 (+) Transcript_27865:436-747(+)|eukprot:CAMPEP_0178738594 /NCGR_PEP_ID=MMETSP0744-20121128/3599_1 /TAXON_ID=913974 /ORGANISM="Nitzschia punctata, Strain CCMP561" /LENGTH=103 /DNA_ID=CAMNT_0020391229 /DNA_START=421 /DNA_END=732 /DNA_ORIENTATION=+
MALRWFAGGDPCDIFQVHGVSHQQVMISVWRVVNAINKCPQLLIEFPTDHNEQLKIAEGFEMWYSSVKHFFDDVNDTNHRLCKHPGFAISFDEMLRKFKGTSV